MCHSFSDGVYLFFSAQKLMKHKTDLKAVEAYEAIKNGEEMDNSGSSFTSGKRTNWSQEQLEAAMSTLVQGQSEDQSVQGAAKVLNIPRRMLEDHLKSVSQVKKYGQIPYLTKEMEAELCSRIFRLCDIRIPITYNFLQYSAFSFCILNNIKHPFSIEKQSTGRK